MGGAPREVPVEARSVGVTEHAPYRRPLAVVMTLVVAVVALEAMARTSAR